MSTVSEAPYVDITDDELTELALGEAHPRVPLPDHAVPIGIYLSQFAPPLPLWYMPPVVRSGHRGWKAPVVLAVVFAFVLIDVMGLCNTFGFLEPRVTSPLFDEPRAECLSNPPGGWGTFSLPS